MRRLSLSPETRARLLKGLGYSSLFSFGLFFFVYLTFPWERLVRLGLIQAEKRAELSIDIEGFSPSLVTGVTADKVTITTKPTPDNKEGTSYVLTDVSARLSLLSLLSGDYKLSFEGDVMGGHVEGSLLDGSNDEKAAELELSGIDLSQIEILSSYTGLPVIGRLSGELSLSIPAKGIRGANGAVALRIEGGKIGEKGAKLDPSAYGGVKTPGYDQSVTLEEGAELGTFTCRVEIENGKGTIQEFAAVGGQVESSLEGAILLKDRLFTSVLSGVLKFRFDEGYVERNGMKLIFTAPTLAQAKTDDGYFAFNINDPLNRLKFKPSRRETKAARPGVGLNNPTQVPRPAIAPGMSLPVTPEVFPPPGEEKRLPEPEERDPDERLKEEEAERERDEKEKARAEAEAEKEKEREREKEREAEEEEDDDEEKAPLYIP